MKRKDFLQTTAQFCLACGGAMLLNGQEMPSQENKEEEKKKKAREAEKRFREAYVLTLMENMEKQLDEKTRVKLMEECGRACARRSGILPMAEKYKRDVKGFVEMMAGELGKDNVDMEGDNTVRWGYPRCYCGLVADGDARLPRTYCFCSVGWVREVFETVAQAPVRVELIQSIKQGAPSCRFLVRL